MTTVTTSTEDEEKSETKETETLSQSGSEQGSSPSVSIPSSAKSSAEIEAEMKRQKSLNLKRFMKDYPNKSIEDRRSWRRRESSLLALRPSQSSEVIREFTKFKRRTASMPARHPKRPTPQHALIFCRNNAHLNWMYENQLNNPTKLMREVLDACVYINEINGKISMAEVIVQMGRKWTIPLWQIEEFRKRELEKRLQQIVDRDRITVKTITDVKKLKVIFKTEYSIKLLIKNNSYK
jgi:hypothetical protein